MMRVNEKGETKNSHTQFMCPKGAVFGGGIQTSPEYHKERGKRQKYGTAHFFADRETIETVVDEVSKSRDDVLLVFDAKNKTASVISLNNIPQDYRFVVAQYRVQNRPTVLDKMRPDNSLLSEMLIKVPDDVKIVPRTTQNTSKTNKKVPKDIAVQLARGGLTKS